MLFVAFAGHLSPMANRQVNACSIVSPLLPTKKGKMGRKGKRERKNDQNGHRKKQDANAVFVSLSLSIECHQSNESRH